MTDFLDEKRKEITERLKELKPLVDEYNRLRGGRLAALAGGVGPARSGRRRARRHYGHRQTWPPGPPPRGRGSQKTAAKQSDAARKPAKAGGKRRAGRRKGSGTRAAEALAFVQGQPGITIPELAAKMGIKQNYLYRVLPGLEAEKKVEKKGRGWHPV